MAYTSTLQPTLPKEKLPNRRGIVGLLDDSIEYIEYIAGNVMGTNESPASAEQFKQTVEEIRPKGLEPGSFTNFQEPRAAEKTEAQRIETVRKTLQNYDVVTEAAKIAQAAESRIDITEQTRLELAGLSDEELAKEGNYQADYRGPSLKAIYNEMWVFFKRVAAKLAGQKEQTASSIAKTRNMSRFTVGENDLLMGGERSGGGHWTTTPG